MCGRCGDVHQVDRKNGKGAWVTFTLRFDLETYH